MDAKTFKNLVYYFMLCAKSSNLYCRLARLTGAFKITLIQCCFSLEGYQIICVTTFLFAKANKLSIICNNFSIYCYCSTNQQTVYWHIIVVFYIYNFFNSFPYGFHFFFFFIFLKMNFVIFILCDSQKCLKMVPISFELPFITFLLL